MKFAPHYGQKIHCQGLTDGQARPRSERFWWIHFYGSIFFSFRLAIDFSSVWVWCRGGSKIDLWDLAGGRENVVRLLCKFIRKPESWCSISRIWCIWWHSLVHILELPSKVQEKVFLRHHIGTLECWWQFQWENCCSFGSFVEVEVLRKYGMKSGEY